MVNNNNGSVIVVGTAWGGSTSKYDMVAIRYDSSGTQLWTTTWDGSGMNDGATNIYTSGTSLYVAGGSQTATTTYKYAILNLKITTGAVLSTRLTGGTAFGIDKITAIQQDQTGNIYVTGGVLNTGTLFDYHTIKLDTALNILWAVDYDGGSSLDDMGTGLNIDSAGNVLVTGYRNTAGGKDFATLKYSSSGTLRWSSVYNGSAGGSDSATAIIVHPRDTNKIYVTGFSYNGSTNDYLTLRVDGAGNTLWDISFNNIYNGEDCATAIALDTNGAVIVCGQNKENNGTYSYTTVKYIEKMTTLHQDTIALKSNSYLFTENRGQLLGTDTLPHPEVKYYTINGGMQTYFTDTSYSFVLAHIDTSVNTADSLIRFDVKYINSNNDLKVRALTRDNTYFNFFLGHIPEGRSNVKNYNQLITFDVWNNVDIIQGSNLQGLKTYFICKPVTGGNPATSVKLHYEGVDSLTVDINGNLTIHTSLGSVFHPKASVWQLDANGNFSGLNWQPDYNITNGNELSFSNFGSYNSSRVLVISMDWGNIQPQNIQNIVWSTYFGGTGNEVLYDSKTDASGNLYVTGYTSNNTFPVAANVIQTNFAGTQDAITGKFNPNGTVAWMTWFGGSNYDAGYGVAVDPSGNVFTTGYSLSGNFPPFNPGGSAYFQVFSGGSYLDAVIFKLTNNGQTCNWSTYYGGTGSDQANAIECDPSGNIFITGWTETSDFPTQTLTGAYSQGFAGPSAGYKDAFIVKFDHVTLKNVWATFYGGSQSSTTEEGRDIAIDASGNIVIVGTTESSTFPTTFPGGSYQDNTLGGSGDGFIVRFNSSCARTWATYYGGSGYEKANGVVFDAAGDIYVVGRTGSTDMPTLQFSGGYWQSTKGTGNDAFMLKFSGSTFARQWATYYGGSGADEGYDLSTDSYGNIYVAGYAGNGFPFPSSNPSGTYTGTYQGGSNGDAFISAFYAGTLVQVWGSYVGSTNDDIGNTLSVDVNGKLFLIGSTGFGSTFPLDNGGGVAYYQGTFAGGSTDGFITSFTLSPVLGISSTTQESTVLSVYPNPTNGELFVTYNGVKGDNLNYTIYNILGEVIQTAKVGKTYGATSYTFDLTGLATGVYFLQAECDGRVVNKKFIKQ